MKFGIFLCKINSLRFGNLPAFLLLVLILTVMVSCEREDEPLPSESLDKTAFLKMVNNLRLKGCRCGTDSMPPVAAVAWNEKLENEALLFSRGVDR